MDQNSNLMKLVIPVVALVIGLGGGYYFGHSRGVASEKAVQEAARVEAEKQAAKAVNPFEQASINPFDEVPTNPFSDVKVNPFK